MKSILKSTLVIIAITTGAAMLSLVMGASVEVAPLEALFLPFISAIIAIQLVPAALLLGGLFKAAFVDNMEEQEEELYDENY